ncbi:hypothetical protein NPIL_444161 [Nephila pilipes]|uniref:Uncharacterized protein n=1 Tax=Nephila pilipes TaxID=299642 RepID=A0A8X6P9M2_NEPPI|nr:hypothetical protein NPIL_444161 [Nephila pilipes]
MRSEVKARHEDLEVKLQKIEQDFHYFQQQIKTGQVETALHWAAKYGNLDVIKLMAGTHKLDSNAKTEQSRKEVRPGEEKVIYREDSRPAGCGSGSQRADPSWPDFHLICCPRIPSLLSFPSRS